MKYFIRELVDVEFDFIILYALSVFNISISTNHLSHVVNVVDKSMVGRTLSLPLVKAYCHE